MPRNPFVPNDDADPTAPPGPPPPEPLPEEPLELLTMLARRRALDESTLRALFTALHRLKATLDEAEEVARLERRRADRAAGAAFDFHVRAGGRRFDRRVDVVFSFSVDALLHSRDHISDVITHALASVRSRVLADVEKAAGFRPGSLGK